MQNTLSNSGHDLTTVYWQCTRVRNRHIWCEKLESSQKWKKYIECTKFNFGMAWNRRIVSNFMAGKERTNG